MRWLGLTAGIFLLAGSLNVSADVSPRRRPPAQWNFEDRDGATWFIDGPHPAAVEAVGRNGDMCLRMRVTGGHSCDQNVIAHPEQWTRAFKKVAIPHNAKYFRMWMKVTGSWWHEQGRVLVDPGSGAKLMDVTGGGNGKSEAYDWACYDIDISEFRGQTVLLGFVAANWNGLGDHETDILIDDAAITDAGKRTLGAHVWPPPSPDARTLTEAEIERNKRLASKGK